MKETSVRAVILVLLCYCLSFGNGDERIEKAREKLKFHYLALIPYSKDPHTLRSRGTIYHHVKDVNDKEKLWQTWLQEHTGYPLEHLYNSPGSMNEGELKLAAEYHLCLSGWCYVRFMTINKAAKRKAHARDKYPRTYKCRNVALAALKYSKHHKDLYAQYFQALGQDARQNILKEHRFPIDVDFENHNHQNAEDDAFLKVKLNLEMHIARLSLKKKSMHLRAAKGIAVIRNFLTPDQMNADPLSIFLNCFSSNDVSQPPDEACRNDREFLEVAWLFNQCRSLWYEIRHKEFLIFLRHQKQDLKASFIRKVKKAIKVTNESFKNYESLSNSYCKMFITHHPDKTVSAQNSLSASDIMEIVPQIHLSENEGLEENRWKGKRKRTTLKKSKSIVSAGTHETADHQYLDDDNLENSRLKTPKLLSTGASGDQPEFNVEIVLPVTGETEEDLFLIDALLDLHSNLAPNKNENNQQLHDAIELDSVSTNPSKPTLPENNHSRGCPNLDDVYQSSSEKCNLESGRAVENSH